MGRKIAIGLALNREPPSVKLKLVATEILTTVLLIIENREWNLLCRLDTEIRRARSREPRA